jgi:hypothetical protein
MPIPESKHYGSAEAVIAMLAYYIRRVQK